MFDFEFSGFVFEFEFARFVFLFYFCFEFLNLIKIKNYKKKLLITKNFGNQSFLFGVVFGVVGF